MSEVIAHRRFRLLESLAIVVVLCATLAIFPALGYASIFSVAAIYDDEGCMLITLQQFIEGHALYDQVFSMYGPFPLLVKWGLFSVLNQPVGHDVGRLICLGFWLATVAACAAVVWRFTRSLVAGWLGVVFGFQALWLIVYEPGHPQELCGLLLVLGVLAATGARPGNDRKTGRNAALLGALAGCLAMTKINIFVFLMMALGGAVIDSTPALRGGPGRALRFIYNLGLLAAPSVLMHGRLGEPSVFAFDVHVTLALLGVLLAAHAEPAPALFSARDYAAFAVGLLVTIVAIAVAVLARGTTLAGLFDGILGNPLRVGTLFGATPPWFRTSWPIPLLIDLLVVGWLVLGRLAPALRLAAAVFLSVGRVAFAAFVLAWATKIRFEIHSVLLVYGVPAAALLLMPPRRGEVAGVVFGRRFLALLTVTTSLWAYPTAGSQRAFASLFAAVALVVIAVDAVDDLVAAWGPRAEAQLRRAAGLAWTGVVLSLLFIYFSEALLARSIYHRRVPLDLPGARAIRVDAETVTRYRRLVAALQNQPDTFFTMPGMYSLHFFTGREPPTTLNLTNWMYIFDDHTQARIIKELEARPHLCVVANRGLIDYWMQGRPLPDAPLVRYIATNFVTVSRIFDDEIRVRRQKPQGALEGGRHVASRGIRSGRAG
jgi:hypothetical protein